MIYGSERSPVQEKHEIKIIASDSSLERWQWWLNSSVEKCKRKRNAKDEESNWKTRIKVTQVVWPYTKAEQ